jgi:uncharacterized protein YjeT (DUF2065 family)
MVTALTALGLVLILEGLVFAVAPGRVEDVLEQLRRMPPEARRLVGLLALTGGAACLAAAAAMG